MSEQTNMSSSGHKLMPLSRMTAMKAMQLRKPQLMKSQFPCAVPKASLRANWPPIYDQGQIGSCTANALCSCFRFLNRKKKFEPSRLYTYYIERKYEANGGPISDSGAFVADGCELARKEGICAEYLYPYDVEKVNDDPPEHCKSDAYWHKSGASYAITTDMLNSVRSCICKGEPVMLAFGVYRSFSSMPASAIAPIPNPKNYQSYNDTVDPFEGGHEVVIVGYDDCKQLLTIANSWGENWGEKGYFYMPYAFFNNHNLIYALDVMSAFETELD